ncbi:hypothetical protein GCM10027020_22230 [Nocardioides salsibiostraticola]
MAAAFLAGARLPDGPDGLVEERVVGFFFVLRVRVLEPVPPRPDAPAPDREVVVLLLREPGGEDVRVAMLFNLGHRHTSPTHHTLRVANGPESPARTELSVTERH